MRNRGLLVANEMHPRRAWDLAENLERWGARNAVIVNEQPQLLADHFGAFFDRVLVDAPCSGEGMFRKSQPARSAWSTALVQRCALRQSSILTQAARLVRPGGRLVYSTCTFAPEENEEVVSRFLDDSRKPGKPAFELVQSVRLWPHLGAPEGHFIAALKRVADGRHASAKPFQARLPAAAPSIFRRFSEENLDDSLTSELLPSLHLEGTYFYALPILLPSLGSLRVVHPGWWLGQLKGERCQPAHALAMAITAPAARRQVCLGVDDPAVLAYLRGESLRMPGESGWTLVTLEGIGDTNAFPIGWGKRSGEVVKNNYPRGLRWI
jgi:NOL1/NOP2/fmu family ribosome biogenesis protein